MNAASMNEQLSGIVSAVKRKRFPDLNLGALLRRVVPERFAGIIQPLQAFLEKENEVREQRIIAICEEVRKLNMIQSTWQLCNTSDPFSDGYGYRATRLSIEESDKLFSLEKERAVLYSLRRTYQSWLE